jgi:hypothetical protein
VQVIARAVARVARQGDPLAGAHRLAVRDQRPREVSVYRGVLTAIRPVPDAHVEAVGIAVIGSHFEHVAARAGVDVAPVRGREIEPLVARLVVRSIDVGVLSEALADGVIVYGPL